MENSFLAIKIAAMAAKTAFAVWFWSAQADLADVGAVFNCRKDTSGWRIKKT